MHILQIKYYVEEVTTRLDNTFSLEGADYNEDYRRRNPLHLTKNELQNQRRRKTAAAARAGDVVAASTVAASNAGRNERRISKPVSRAVAAARRLRDNLANAAARSAVASGDLSHCCS